MAFYKKRRAVYMTGGREIRGHTHRSRFKKHYHTVLFDKQVFGVDVLFVSGRK